jgi:ornithine carbamoyltransferase
MAHLLSLAELSPRQLWELLYLARDLKAEWSGGGNRPILAGQVLGMVFQKPSLRTRVSFEVAMLHLGGTALYLSPSEIQLGARESVADVARVLSRYVNGIMARVFSHRDLEQLAEHATVPIINGLSDYSHPCQGLGDILTIWEHFGDLAGRRLVFVGDGNNVANSLMFAGALAGMDVVVAAPSGYEPHPAVVRLARSLAVDTSGHIEVSNTPAEAVRGAHVLYTDVWTSMGQEAEAEQRRARFAGFQINELLVGAAATDAIVMHCLPAHRGEEITGAVADGPQSVLFDQAENRLHAQKAVLAALMGPA